MTSPPIAVQSAVELAPLTTLELGGPASYACEVFDDEHVLAALDWANNRDLETLVLGGGSNIVVSDSGFQGLVIRMLNRRCEIEDLGNQGVITVGAGQDWDAVVAASVAAGYSGIECLSGIPGTAGAAPVQNIGAYGQDIAEVLRSVDVIDQHDSTRRTLVADACGFAYRDSVFKQQPTRWIIIGMQLRLVRNAEFQPHYGELKRALGTKKEPTPQSVRETVLGLRRSKSMLADPDDPFRRSVGSFFMNPIVCPDDLERVRERNRSRGQIGEVPAYELADGQIKLSAAWLIETSGFAKGYRRGPVGISDRHALCLVHHGGGSTRDLVALAREIRDGVERAFDITLKPEPTFVGFAEGNPLGECGP